MRVLVVEDEPRLAEALRAGLTETGYLVDIARDGIKGIGMGATGDYDVVILDWLIPGRDGLEVCRELRHRGVGAAIIMLTARDTLNDKVQGLDSGADDYITKPFEFPELLARVRSQFRRTQNSRRRVITVADLEVDTVSREVRRGGQTIQLTSKEYSLLEYLAYNAGRVLTRDQILCHVWPSGYDGFSNTVDVFIRYLRRKIDDGHTAKIIHTVIGTGYTLRAQR